MKDYSEKLKDHDEASSILTAAMQSGAYDSAHIEALLDQMEFDRVGLVILSGAYQQSIEAQHKAYDLERMKESALNK